MTTHGAIGCCQCTGSACRIAGSDVASPLHPMRQQGQPVFTWLHHPGAEAQYARPLVAASTALFPRALLAVRPTQHSVHSTHTAARDHMQAAHHMAHLVPNRHPEVAQVVLARKYFQVPA